MFGTSEAAQGRTRVKICGITNAEDALAAIDAGADALGWNFFPRSKRFIAPEQAIDIIRSLPEPTAHFAVLVNPRFDEAIALATCGVFAALQLHGDETPEFCRRLADAHVRFAKAIPMTQTAPPPVSGFQTNTIVLDSAAGGEFGGTGKTFPWHVAVEVRRRNPELRFIVAGGLTPDNVAEAINVVRPFGVDVTSGIEESAGKKDHARMRAFIAAARSA